MRKELTDIKTPHEKRAYITTFRSALERGYEPDVLRQLASQLKRDHPQGEHATKVALEYLDEAVQEVEKSSDEEIKKISEELADIKTPHEKKAYITVAT